MSDTTAAPPIVLAIPHTAQARSITAAAKRIDPHNAADVKFATKKTEHWTDEAWTYFDSVPEIKFAGRFNGNALSRLRLYPSVVLDPDEPPVPIQDAAANGDFPSDIAIASIDEMDRLNDSPDGIEGLMREFGVILSMSGDSYLIGDDNDDGAEEWNVYSESAVSKVGGTIGIREAPGEKPRPVGENAVIIRVWRRHSRWRGLADSNMRSILAECEELLIASRQFRAIMRSRNAAGILFLSTRLDLPRTTPNGQQQLTSLEQGITESMITPTYDDGSAASVMPHVVRGDGKPEELIKHFPLDRKIDDQAIARVTFLIQRLAHGLDTPVEVLTGIADVNHWSGWQIEDTTYKAHLEPLAKVPATAIGSYVIRPALLARFPGREADINRVLVGIDPSALVTRPNRAADAKDAFDRIAISWEAYRRYTGMSDTDAPSDEEVELRATMGLGLFKRSGIAVPGETLPGIPAGGDAASGGGDGSGQAARIAAALGLIAAPAQERIAITAAARPVPAPTDLGARLGRIDQRLRDRLQIAASNEMESVLRVAGNRLRSRVQGNATLSRRVRGVSGADVFRHLAAGDFDSAGLLDGAFSDLGVEFDQWVGKAQADVIREIRRAAPDPATADAAVAAYQQGQDDRRHDGWAILLAGLLLLADRRILTPDATPDIGEHDPSMSVPAGTIREALARVGGSRQPGDNPRAAITDDGVTGGLGQGPAAVAAVEAVGQTVAGLVWQVGAPFRPFDPHQALDGVEFAGWEDPAVQYDDWPAMGGPLFPGDHDGCQCVVWLATTQAETDSVPDSTD